VLKTLGLGLAAVAVPLGLGDNFAGYCCLGTRLPHKLHMCVAFWAAASQPAPEDILWAQQEAFQPQLWTSLLIRFAQYQASKLKRPIQSSEKS
jgi:hypothetical protein